MMMLIMALIPKFPILPHLRSSWGGTEKGDEWLCPSTVHSPVEEKLELSAPTRCVINAQQWQWLSKRGSVLSHPWCPSHWGSGCLHWCLLPEILSQWCFIFIPFLHGNQRAGRALVPLKVGHSCSDGQKIPSRLWLQPLLLWDCTEPLPGLSWLQGWKGLAFPSWRWERKSSQHNLGRNLPLPDHNVCSGRTFQAVWDVQEAVDVLHSRAEKEGNARKYYRYSGARPSVPSNGWVYWLPSVKCNFLFKTRREKIAGKVNKWKHHLATPSFPANLRAQSRTMSIPFFNSH